MVFDELSNASLYKFDNPRIARGLEFLRSEQAKSLPVGRSEIDGDHLFALVQEYTSRPESECIWEAHRKYIDIQFLISGRERIDHAPVSSLKIVKPYDPAKEKMELTGAGSSLHLLAGMLTIFFPHDAHRPCVAIDRPEAVRKIVLKVQV